MALEAQRLSTCVVSNSFKLWSLKFFYYYCDKWCDKNSDIYIVHSTTHCVLSCRNKENNDLIFDLRKLNISYTAVKVILFSITNLMWIYFLKQILCHKFWVLPSAMFTQVVCSVTFWQYMIHLQSVCVYNKLLDCR